METLNTNIFKNNLQKVQNIINEYKIRDDVKLIAVTKYVDSKTIRELFHLGVRDFGENRSQDLLYKQEELKDINDEINWHFIGRLQRRPVKTIINKIDTLQSLDRMSLVEEVDKRANHPISSFLQVNISGELQKAGFKPEELLDIVHEIEKYPNIKVIGLMTMTPYDANEVELRKYFSQMKLLQEQVQKLNLPYAPCHELSMGMSNDFKIAIEEGATIIRVGSALFK